jgi:hypothetical protein
MHHWAVFGLGKNERWGQIPELIFCLILTWVGGVGFGGFFAKILRFVNCNQGADSHNSRKESPSCNCRQLRHFITATKYHRQTSKVAASKNTVY